MKIQVGEICMTKVTQQKITYVNKTKKYLLPCLQDYGADFTYQINNVFKVAVGIGDIVTDNCGFTHEKHIFILLDSSIANSFFIKFLDWIREQSMYQDDYVFDNIQKSTFHMVVLKFPERFYESFDTFKSGKYSNMFDQDTIETFFGKFPKIKKVLIKDHNYKIEFIHKLNKFFGSTVKPDEYEGELDLPPNESEIFNHHLKKR